MTATLDGVTNKKDKPEPTAEQKLAEELVARARERGVSLTGPGGLLKQLTKTVLETALNQEMTEHLGHEKHGEPVTGNVRDGTRPKLVIWPRRVGDLDVTRPLHDDLRVPSRELVAVAFSIAWLGSEVEPRPDDTQARDCLASFRLELYRCFTAGQMRCLSWRMRCWLPVAR
jgi:Transposase, Mutator family